MYFDNVIKITRGDYLKLPLRLKRLKLHTKHKVVIEPGDLVYFGLMYPGDSFEQAFLKREYSIQDVNTDGDLSIILYPEDTLELSPGIYYYSIKALYEEDNKLVIDTLIQNTKFIVMD